MTMDSAYLFSPTSGITNLSIHCDGQQGGTSAFETGYLAVLQDIDF